MKILICKKQGQKFQFVDGLDKNSNVYKKRPEFQRLEGYGKNSRVYKNKARSPMFERMRSIFLCVNKIRPELQCFQG